MNLFTTIFMFFTAVIVVASVRAMRGREKELIRIKSNNEIIEERNRKKRIEQLYGRR